VARPIDQLAVPSPPLSPSRLPGLTAVVPVHDEEATLAAVVEGLLGVLPAVARRWELVIVDDGSRDATAAIADRLARERSTVRVVRHGRNRGYGAALRSGFAVARHDFVFWMDGDGQFDPRELPALVAALGDRDAAVGYRRRRADPWPRRLNTVAWNALVRACFGLAVRDVNCAFKLVRRAALAAAMPAACGAMVSTELLVRLGQRGCRIAEVPVGHFPRRAGRPSGAAPRVVLRAFVELARLAPRLWRPARPGLGDAIDLPADQRAPAGAVSAPRVSA
jgi:cellulose synthase/poly-beta-1,6-N-acetylglucosamine synthase-like glycosyltransferase